MLKRPRNEISGVRAIMLIEMSKIFFLFLLLLKSFDFSKLKVYKAVSKIIRQIQPT